MTITSEKLATGIVRRDLLAFAATAAAAQCAAAMPAAAQSQASQPARDQPPAKPTIVLERLAMGVLLIGIDRAEAQNRIDIATFAALGQAYYEFEHDDGLRAGVLYGKGPDFSQGLDLASWALVCERDRFRRRQGLLIRSARAGPSAQNPSWSPCKGT